MTDVRNADFTGAIVRGADFGTSLGFSTGFTSAQLYSTASYALHDLSGIGLASDSEGALNDVRGWDLSNQNLTNASFDQSPLTNANFSGAIIKGTDFSDGGLYGGQLSAAQLYSSSSYAAHDLNGIKLVFDDLHGWNFETQNLNSAKFNSTYLVGASFRGAVLQSADFSQWYANPSVGPTNQDKADYSDADLRGATGWVPVATTITHNTIRPDGSIQGLALLAGEHLMVRNDPIAVSVTTTASFAQTSALEFVLDRNWTSPVGFASGLTPTLGGTLDLEIASGTDPATLVGTTFQLFNWSGPLPPGDQFSSFETRPGLSWDLTNLYTTGTVTLTSIPEPSTVLLIAIGLSAGAMFARRRKRGFFMTS